MSSEKSRKELMERARELEKRIERLDNESREISKTDKKSRENLSRRSFLKKLGASTIGLGAMGLASSSALKLTKNGVFDNGTRVSSGLNKALAEGKVLADDGNVYSSVQTAVDNASSYVKIGPGTFNEAVVVSNSGLTIEGTGYKSLVDGGTTGTAIETKSSDITVKNLSVRTSPGNGNNAFGVLVRGANNNVENVTVRDTDRIGVIVRADNVKVSNCIFEAAEERAIDTLNKNGIFSSNIIKSGVSGRGILSGGDDVIITSNVITGVSQGINSNAADGLIGGNRIHNTSDDGIVIQTECDDMVVYNNRISDVGGSYIRKNGTNTTYDGNLTGAAN